MTQKDWTIGDLRHYSKVGKYVINSGEIKNVDDTSWFYASMANKRISLVLDASQRRSFDMSINE